MYCSSCGKEIDDGDKFCSFCGEVQEVADEEPQGNPAVAAQVKNLETSEIARQSQAAVPETGLGAKSGSSAALEAGSLDIGSSASPDRKKPGSKVGLIAAIIAVVVIVVLIVVITPGSSTKSDTSGNINNGANTAATGNSGNTSAAGNNNISTGNTESNAGADGSGITEGTNNGAENSGGTDNAGGNANGSENSGQSGDPENSSGNSADNTSSGNSDNSGAASGSNSSGNSVNNANNSDNAGSSGSDSSAEVSGNYLFMQDHFLFGMEKPHGAEDYVGMMVGKDGNVWKLPHEVMFRTFSADGTRGLAYSGENVYYIQPGKEPELTEMAQDSSAISSGGKTVLSTTQSQGYEGTHGDGDPEIGLYIKKYGDGGKTEDIDSGYYFNSLAISPSGSAVVYTVECLDQSIVTRIYLNGKRTDLPFVLPHITAVTDDGKLIYYFSEDYNIFYVYADDEAKEIVKASDMYSLYALPRYYNYDNTQLYFMYNGVIYLVDKGKILTLDTGMSGSISVAVPYNTQRYLRTEDSADIFYGIKTFRGCYFWNASGAGVNIYYLDETFRVHNVVDNADQYGLVSDGSALVYSAHGNIFRAHYEDSKIVTETLVETSASIFQMSADGQTIYYLLEDMSDLYVMENGGKPKLIAGNVTSLESYFSDPFMCIVEGNKLYYASEGAVYCAEGSKTTEITGWEGEIGFIYGNAFSAVINSHAADYSSNYTYVIAGGKIIEFNMY